MLIWTAKLSKKKMLLPVIVLAAVILVCLFFRGQEAAPESAVSQLLTNEDRVAYLGGWGWEVTPEPLETLQFLLPEKLEEPYSTYARLQAEQGLDFAGCAGQQVSRYTYAVTNYPDRKDVQANLYLCQGYPVGGDVFCPGANGFQAGLTYPGAE